MTWGDALGALKVVAPAISTYLGGPLAGFAVKFLCDKLGVPEGTQEALTAKLAGATPADMLAIKKADQDFEVQMKELDIQAESVAAQDRANARMMQMSTRSIVAPALAILITIGFFSVLGGMIYGHSAPDDTAFNIMLGSLGTAWTMVVSFYYGSSVQSHMQTRMMVANGNGNGHAQH